jgi:hypothetical protein
MIQNLHENIQEIMNGVLSSRYAFVEQLEQTHMDKKTFTIDKENLLVGMCRYVDCRYVKPVGIM